MPSHTHSLPMVNVSGGQWQIWNSTIKLVHTNEDYIQAFMDCM